MDIQFIDPVPAVLEEARRITGKDIEFIPRDNMPTYAIFKIARKSMPSHLIYYRKDHDDIINHIIVHECGHLFRIFRCPENQRLMPYSDREIKISALRKIEHEMTELAKVIPVEKIPSFMDFCYNGLVHQLTNLPPDIMIEKWIFNEFPALRQLQLKSLNKQLADSVVSFTKPESRMMPHTILYASNVMSYAFFRILGFHVGQNFIRQFRSMPYLDKGKELAALTEKEHVDSHQGDNLMIDKWADFLNVPNWFKWRNFEDIPSNYTNV